MSELLLKVGDGANYEDGDVLFACNHRMILGKHAMHICCRKKAARNSSGLIVPDALFVDFCEQTYQYKFERISASEIRRTEMTTGKRERFGPTPNENGEAIDVRLYLKRRRKHPHHRIVGEDGSEIWYGGRSDYSLVKMEAVWDAIETKSAHRRNEQKHQRWPMGRLDIRSHLAVRAEELTDEEVQQFVAPEVEVNANGDPVWRKQREGLPDLKAPGTLTDPPDGREGWEISYAAKRQRNIAWRDLLSDINATETEVTDPLVPVGDEIVDPEGTRYQSKTQPDQRRSRIERKRDRRN